MVNNQRRNTMKTKVQLIGGRLDGAPAWVEEGRPSVTLHEVDDKTNLRNGRHLMYTLANKDHWAWRDGEPRYVFSDLYIDGQIVDFTDGPLKGSQSMVPIEDGYILMRCQSGEIAAYHKTGSKVTFAKSFPQGKEAEAEAFAKENVDKE